MSECPCCGAPEFHGASIDYIIHTLPPIAAMAVRALRDKGPLTAYELSMSVYNGRPPESSSNNISRALRRSKQDMADIGWRVTTRRGRNPTYKLVRVDV